MMPNMSIPIPDLSKLRKISDEEMLAWLRSTNRQGGWSASVLEQIANRLEQLTTPAEGSSLTAAQEIEIFLRLENNSFNLSGTSSHSIVIRKLISAIYAERRAKLTAESILQDLMMDKGIGGFLPPHIETYDKMRKLEEENEKLKNENEKLVKGLKQARELLGEDD